MHLNSDPMHHIHYVFESIKYYGVFFVLLLTLSYLFCTLMQLFLLLLLHSIDERLDGA